MNKIIQELKRRAAPQAQIFRISIPATTVSCQVKVRGG